MLVDLSCAACLLGLAGAQSAEPAARSGNAVEEIVVTGERVPRSLLRTPSSVAVTTTADIEAQAAPYRIEQLLALVPNVQLGSGGQGPTIRGQDSTGVLQDLPAFLGGTRPRVTLQVDGRAVGYQEFVFGLASVWDVQQVEVFRSPQTTTQGRNSIAGAIFVHTNDPTYAWEAEVRGIVGDLDARQASAVISGPIVAEELAFRVAGDVRRSRPSSDIADRIAGADPGRDDYGLARLKLLATPGALSAVRLELTFNHLESHAPPFAGLRRPFKARRDPVDGYGAFRVNVDSATAVLDYRLTRVADMTTTVAYGDAVVRRFSLPGLGLARTATRDLSVESIVRWRPEGPLQAIGGVHHLRTRLDQFIDVSLLAGIGDFDDTQHSFGLFGEASWQAAPRLALTAGLRYQRDDQRRTGFLGRGEVGTHVDYDEAFDAWLPKVSIAYDLADGISAGLLIQRAFNPGGMTVAIDTGALDTFGAETLWAYEAFARASLAEGGLKLAANLFYYDMTNAQRPQTSTVDRPDGVAVVTAFDNAPHAESYGLEVQADWRASERLGVKLGVGLLKTRILETVNRGDPIRGKDFQRSPALTLSASIDWRPVAPLQLSAQIRHSSGYYSNDANTPAFRIGSATEVDGRAAYTVGRVTLFGFVRNAFDAFNLTLIYSPPLATATDPRTIGLGVEARF